MSGNIWFNPARFNPQQFNYSLALAAQTDPRVLQQAAQLQQLFGQDALLASGYGSRGFQTQGFPANACGCMPSPAIQFSGAPAGRGLAPNADGKGVKTAGGYEVAATGNSAGWQIKGPDGKPLYEVSGDPHIYKINADGSKTHIGDFTKDSQFRLPDGTVIACDTTSEHGRSVTQGLTIMNGNDAVKIEGIANNQIKRGEITATGFDERAKLDPKQDIFHIGGSAEANGQKIFIERNGKMEGELYSVGGSKYNGDQYIPEAKAGTEGQYFVDPRLRPQIGSDAWGNQLRGEMVDVARRTGSPEYAKQMAQLAEADHFHGMLVGALGYDPTQMFGGYGQWGGFPQQQFSVGNLFQLLYFQEAQNQLFANQRYNTINV